LSTKTVLTRKSKISSGLETLLGVSCGISAHRPAHCVACIIGFGSHKNLLLDCPPPTMTDPLRIVWTPGSARFLLRLFGREIPGRRVDALPIVVAREAAELIAASLLARRPDLLVNQLHFQRMEE
jgi:hypothetical protein